MIIHLNVLKRFICTSIIQFTGIKLNIVGCNAPYVYSCDHIPSVSAVTVRYFRCFPSSWKPGGCFKMDI